MSEEKKYYSFTKKFWKIFAPVYDVAVILISGIRDKVAGLIESEANLKVLDVGTGTGKQAFAFGKKGYDVTGVDISGSMLKIAERKNKHENVKFMLADATNLPFQDRSFDVTCASLMLHDMPLSVVEEALNEMARVTKTDGMIVIVEYDLPKNPVGRFLVYNLIRIYEIKYYSGFIKSDFESLLNKSGIKIEEKLKVLAGAGKILKCRKV